MWTSLYTSIGLFLLGVECRCAGDSYSTCLFSRASDLHDRPVVFLVRNVEKFVKGKAVLASKGEIWFHIIQFSE